MQSVKVFLTVDVEGSIGGAFSSRNLNPVGLEKRAFCCLDGKAYGIPLIMKIADRYGLKLTFFVETLNSLFFGRESTRIVVDHILEKGHDVQLHMHPNFQSFRNGRYTGTRYSDLLGKYEINEQIAIIGEAKSILIEEGASNVKAFRAGCFAASHDTLKALAKSSLLIDSSYNRAYVPTPCLLEGSFINDSSCISGIVEFPVTNFKSRGLKGKWEYRPLDINGASFREMKYVLDKAASLGIANVTVIGHSFSFVKAYEQQYNRVRPRWQVIRRFEKLCHFLASNYDKFQVVTFGSLVGKDLRCIQEQKRASYPFVPLGLSLMRFSEQIADLR